MKVNPWLLPGAALLVTGSWIIHGRQASSALEREIHVLVERTQQVRSGGSLDSPNHPEEGTLTQSHQEKIDWKGFGTKMAQSRGAGGPSDLRSYMRIQKLLFELSPEELSRQLEEIEALETDDTTRDKLRSMILSVLADKDPKRMLEAYGDKLLSDESGASWQLKPALYKLAETDIAAAVAWMDARIAEGKFASKSLDGKNHARLYLEGALLGQLLKTDLAAATERVTALPEDQREELLRSGQMEKETDPAVAKLIRDTLPPDKVENALANQAGNFVKQGGFERVDEFIASANASDAEKAAIVAKAMESQLTRHGGASIASADLDKARAWGATQSPAAVDKATGEILGSTLWRKGNFEEASAIVLQYHQNSTSDEVLAGFLKSLPVRNGSADKAASLISQIHDPALRAEIQELPEYNKPSAKP